MTLRRAARRAERDPPAAKGRRLGKGEADVLSAQRNKGGPPPGGIFLAERNYRQYQKKRRSQALLAQACLGVLIVALLFGISYAVVMMLHGRPVLPALGTAARPETQSTPVGASGAPEEPPAQDLSAPGADSAPEQPPQAEPLAQSWNTDQLLEGRKEVIASDSRLLALPANGRLSEEYFRSVLFIGDSLSQGFYLYPPTKDRAAVCAFKSTSPYQVLQNYVGELPDRSRIEMWDLINIQAPANIYLLYGTNALIAQTDEAFLKSYGELMDRLRERFPGVPIYVQGITPTARRVTKPQLENGHIRLINNAIAKMAVDRGLYYLEVQEVLADAEGYLREEFLSPRGDGIHMLDNGYAVWAEYILTHTVHRGVNEQYVTQGPYA